MKFFLRKKSLHTLGRGEGVRVGWVRIHYDLSLYLFQFLKVSSLNFVVQTMIFQAKPPSHCYFKVMQYGYEIS